MWKRPRKVAGRKLPRTRTSSVPIRIGRVSLGDLERGGDREGVGIEKGWHTVAGLIEAMRRVAVRGEDRDAVAEVLQTDRGVDDEALGAADAEVGVEEYDTLAVGHC